MYGKPKWKKFNIIKGGYVNSSFDVTKDKGSVINILRQHDFIYTNVKPTRGNACLYNIF